MKICIGKETYRRFQLHVSPGRVFVGAILVIAQYPKSSHITLGHNRGSVHCAHVCSTAGFSSCAWRTLLNSGKHVYEISCGLI